MDIIGVAWNVACYFVVPVLAFENLSPGGALHRSAEIFKQTWGKRSASAWASSFPADAAGLRVLGRRSAVLGIHGRNYRSGSNGRASCCSR